jgi:hypothetical protein
VNCPNCQYYSCSIPREPCPKCGARTTAIYDAGKMIYPMRLDDGAVMMVYIPEDDAPCRVRVEAKGDRFILHRIPETVTIKQVTDYSQDETVFFMGQCKDCTLEWRIPFRTFDDMTCPFCKQGEELRTHIARCMELAQTVNMRWSEAAAYVACDHACPCERRLLERGLTELKEQL